MYPQLCGASYKMFRRHANSSYIVLTWTVRAQSPEKEPATTPKVLPTTARSRPQHDPSSSPWLLLRDLNFTGQTIIQTTDYLRTIMLLVQTVTSPNANPLVVPAWNRLDHEAPIEPGPGSSAWEAGDGAFHGTEKVDQVEVQIVEPSASVAAF